MSIVMLLFFISFFLRFIYLFWERERVQAGVSQRERKRENPKQVLCWQQGLNSPTMRPWLKLKSRVGMLGRLSHPGAPLFLFLKLCFFMIRFAWDYFTLLYSAKFHGSALSFANTLAALPLSPFTTLTLVRHQPWLIQQPTYSTSVPKKHRVTELTSNLQPDFK